ncbi:MAG TPA: glycine betaine ABC transporter substrate-binding protein, partial [Chthoniobacterales bacterium]
MSVPGAPRSGDLQSPTEKKGDFKSPLLGLLLALYLMQAAPCLAEPILVGSKKFTESYVLAEIAKRTLENSGLPTEHRQGMGGTIILWQALRTNQIGLYPEYTGTIGEEILKTSPATTAAEMREQLAKFGVGMTGELGFNNTYALVMQRAAAEQKQIRRISDLRNHPELKLGLTHEFLNRRDGWRPLSEKYQLATQNLVGIDHGLGYEALRNGSIDLKDAYSTDAKIGENDLVVLEDDLQFFPQYKAVFLYRLTLPPNAVAVLRKLEGTLDGKRMIKLNAEAERTKNYARAADLYFTDGASSQSTTIGESFSHKLWRWTARHLQLAGISLILSILVGIPLGVAASRGGAVGQVILGITGA